MIKINLAPPPRERKRAQRAQAQVNLGLVFGLLLVLLVGGIGVYWWVLSAETARLGREIAQQQQELERLRLVIAEGQRVKREKEELERRVNAIEAVARLQTRPVYLIDALADMLPKDLWLTRMEEKGHLLRLAGTSFSTTAIADFMANLKASGRFVDVDLVEHKQDLTKSPRTITFEVSCRFEI
jgi:type IV pilus assembly protein PilN